MDGAANTRDLRAGKCVKATRRGRRISILESAGLVGAAAPSPRIYSVPASAHREYPVSQFIPKLFTNPAGEEVVENKTFTLGTDVARSSRSLIEQSQRGGLKNPPRARLG
jgi:hypothetical protein